MCSNLDLHYTAFGCLFLSLKEAVFHDCQYNYFYEWVLQSLLWLDNDIITTTIGPCLTSDQHRSSVLFLFMRRVCRCRISLHCRCKSGSVSFVALVDICLSFLPWSRLHPCVCTLAGLPLHSPWALLHNPVHISQKFDAYLYSCLGCCRRCLWASVWCLVSICGHEFSLPSEAPIFLIPISSWCCFFWRAKALTPELHWDVRQILRFLTNPHLSTQKDALWRTNLSCMEQPYITVLIFSHFQ